MKPWIKPLFFLLCLSPMLWMIGNALWGDLGANPVETVTFQTGDWALRLLLLTLALSPLRRLTGWSGWLRLRRMAGLFVYFYASSHFLIWFLADHSLDVVAMWTDVLERPYIMLGFSAWLLLAPLAITSTQGWMRRLGRRWKSLHRLVYLILILAIAHYLWLVKADYLLAGIHALIAAALLSWRLPLRGLFRFGGERTLTGRRRTA
jgi:sulfoxide reductase heme-binding subunit YedZ